MTQPASGCESVSVTAEVDGSTGSYLTTQPQDDHLCGSCYLCPLVYLILTVVVVHSIQWYENTVNNNTTGTPIPGATSSSYTPGGYSCCCTTHYYCVLHDLLQWM